MLGLGVTLLAAASPWTRQEAAELVDTQLLPSSEYGRRTRLSRPTPSKNQQSYNSRALTANDPSTAFTYGEFPLTSLDDLLDDAVSYVQIENKHFRVVDIGSGCGRLCLYLALSRPSDWDIHGIECKEALHKEATRAAQVAVDQGWLASWDEDGASSSLLHFHHGMVADLASTVLGSADLLFIYATALPSGPFLPDPVQGVSLSREWHEWLGHCRPGSVVITTDRALDPAEGWDLLKRWDDVPNPEVLGSTVFVQRWSGSR